MKLKTHSGTKKRFSITGTGKIKATQAGKQHFMRRRTKSQIRNLRGTTILLNGAERKNIKKHLLMNH